MRTDSRKFKKQDEEKIGGDFSWCHCYSQCSVDGNTVFYGRVPDGNVASHKLPLGRVRSITKNEESAFYASYPSRRANSTQIQERIIIFDDEIVWL